MLFYERSGFDVLLSNKLVSIFFEGQMTELLNSLTEHFIGRMEHSLDHLQNFLKLSDREKPDVRTSSLRSQERCLNGVSFSL